MSADNVLPFPERTVEVQVWTCHCGSEKWQMLNGGRFRCAECRGRCSFRWFDPREPEPGAA